MPPHAGLLQCILNPSSGDYCTGEEVALLQGDAHVQFFAFTSRTQRQGLDAAGFGRLLAAWSFCLLIISLLEILQDRMFALKGSTEHHLRCHVLACQALLRGPFTSSEVLLANTLSWTWQESCG